MDPNNNPTPSPAPGSGKKVPPRDPLPTLGDAINDAYRESQATALETGRQLVRARAQLRHHEDWVAWLSGTCDLSHKGAERYMRLASKDEEARKESPLFLPPSDESRVVCGWCLHARAEEGLPPKHLSGPRRSEHVRHGECAECREAVERVLRRFREEDPCPLDATDADLNAFRAVEWNLACSKLRSAFHHTDEAFEAMRTLRDLQNGSLRRGVKLAFKKLVQIQDRLRQLTCELVLLSEGSFFDASLFEPDVPDEEEDDEDDWYVEPAEEPDDDEFDGYGGPDA